jgi:hypothetical protein
MTNSLRERVAMAIHTETTQIPGKVPHECDYAAADKTIEIYARLITFVKSVADGATYDTMDAGECLSLSYKSQAQDIVEEEKL